MMSTTKTYIIQWKTAMQQYFNHDTIYQALKYGAAKCLDHFATAARLK